MKADNASKDGGSLRDSGIRRTGPVGEPQGGGESLPRLLSETIGSLGAPDPSAPWAAVLTPEDRVRLAAAVDRRGGQAAIGPELAADLVEAVLPRSLTAMVVDVRSRRRLAEQIARTLLEDPRSAERLQSLVAALRAAAPPAGVGPSRSTS